MANHAFDCKSCGNDLRVLGGCCDEQIEARKKRWADERAEWAYKQATLDKYGLGPLGGGTIYQYVDADKVLALLYRLERDGDEKLAAVAAERLAKSR